MFRIALPMVRPVGNAIESDGTPDPLVTSTELLAVAKPLRVLPDVA